MPSNVERTPSQLIGETSQTRLGRELEPLVAQHPGQSGFYGLNKGTEAFALRFDLIRSAEKSVDVQYYIWHDDLTGRVLYNRLLAAADRGVRVRILLDDLDTAGKESMLDVIDAHPNIEIRVFNPFANRQNRFLDFLTDTRRVNRRMHNKTLTADNQATIFGGRNIGDEYFDATEEVGFSDLDVLAIGPVVNEVSESFDIFWNSEWAYPLAAFLKGQPAGVDEINGFRQASDAFLEAAGTSDYANALRALKIANLSGLADLDFSWGDWKLVYDQPGKVVARQVEAETHLAPVLKGFVDQTKSELIIVSPYFVPGASFTSELVELVNSGTRVRIMTNSLASNDVPLVHAGYMRYREDLIKGGVELYEFKPLIDLTHQVNKKKGQWTGSSRASLHGKYLGFDRRYIFIGSFNLDARSVALNTELGVILESPKDAEFLADSFDQLAMVKGYRLVLTDDGDLQWITLDSGTEKRFEKEPETAFWSRFSTRFMSIFVPESQL